MKCFERLRNRRIVSALVGVGLFGLTASMAGAEDLSTGEVDAGPPAAPARYASPGPDPFRSPLGQRWAEAPRPDGLAGTAVEEIVLVGILREAKSGIFHALLRARDGKSHRAGPGERLWNGRVVAVSATGVELEREFPAEPGLLPEAPQRIEVKLRPVEPRAKKR